MDIHRQTFRTGDLGWGWGLSTVQPLVGKIPLGTSILQYFRLDVSDSILQQKQTGTNV